MKVKAVPSSWIHGERRRLDVGPYLYGAVEARERIRRLDAPKEPLKSLTAGCGGGIFNGPQFSRRWVTDPAHGVPFLGSSSMLLADLSHLPLLSRKHADSPKLRHLEIRPGMTLTSCSGTIGRMVYARPDMAGMRSSQDIMKVCPDPARIPPGFLYAFLSSRFGLPLVTAGGWGLLAPRHRPRAALSARADAAPKPLIAGTLAAAGAARLPAIPHWACALVGSASPARGAFQIESVRSNSS